MVGWLKLPHFFIKETHDNQFLLIISLYGIIIILAVGEATDRIWVVAATLWRHK